MKRGVVMQEFVSGYYRLAVWITRLAYLNVLWLTFTIMGLGLFGIMPATVAMFSVIRKWNMGEEDIPVFKTFWKSYREDFLKANGIGIIFFLIGYLLVIQFNYLFFQPSIIYKTASFSIVALFILYAIVMTYFFPIFVHFNLKVIDYLKWPFIIGFIHPILTIVMICGIGIMIYIVFLTIPALLFFFGGSVIAYILMLGVSQTFSKYEAEAS